MSSSATSQSIQKLLDENAQLIRALVENMSIKGKAMECIKYQQSLHKNLEFLARLADPTLNVQTILPPPGTFQRQQAHGSPGQTPPSTATTASQSAPGGGGGGGGGVSSHMTTSAMTAQRQPQVTPASSGNGLTPAQMQSLRQTPPGQYPSGAGKGYGAMWSGQGQGDPYGMQRHGSMGPGGGYHMGMSPDQQLRLRQEQMIQAQQARRMQQAGGGAMYPGMVAPHQQGMPGPPGYPPTTMNPHSIPPGMKLH